MRLMEMFKRKLYCRTSQAFLLSTGLLLIVLALSELFTLASSIDDPLAFEKQPDPVFPLLPTGLVHGCAAICELLLALLIFRKANERLLYAGLAWLVMLLAMYQVALRTIAGPARPCGCSGFVGTWLEHFTHLPVNTWHLAILAYWSAGILTWSLAQVICRHRGKCLHLLLFILLVVLTPATRADYVHIDGISWAEVPLEARKFVKVHEGTTNYVTFEVKVQPREWWQIALRYSGPATRANVRFVVAGNFTNVFSTFVDLSSSHEDMLMGSDVTLGAYPANELPETALLWLAFASSFYYESGAAPSPLPLPWRVAAWEPEAHICDSQVAFLNPGYLPADVIYITSNGRLESAAKNPMLHTAKVVKLRPGKTISLHHKYLPGVCLGWYRVHASTNLLGRSWPLAFTLEWYQPLDHFKSPPSPQRVTRNTNTIPVRLWTGQITRIEVHPGSISRAAPVQRMRFSDYRLNAPRYGLDAVEYDVTNGQWPVTVDAAMLDAYAKQASAARSMYLKELAVRTAMRLILVVLVLVPFIYLALPKRRRSDSIPGQP